MAILPLNEEKEIKECCKKLEKELIENDLRAKIFSEKSLNYRIRQIYKKKIPYYLVIGKEEIKENILKLMHIYLPNQEEKVKEKELIEKLIKLNYTHV